MDTVKDKPIRLEVIYPPPRERVVKFITYLNDILANDWEYYIQPHLNGLKPDLVMLHPKYGIIVIDFETIATDGSWKRKWMHLEMMEKEIRELYCPRLGLKSNNKTITTALLDPSDNLYQSPNSKHPIENLDLFFDFRINATQTTDDDFLNDLRLWLVEPDAVKEKFQPLELDDVQKFYAKNRSKKGYRRLTGPAGSGKSLVLAARAANLIAEGKNVAIFSYNITLINYLSSLALRHYSRSRLSATWIDFFMWLKRISTSADMSENHREIFIQGEFPSDNSVAILATNALNRIPEAEVQIYDAILIDEGQDFSPKWWQVLRNILRPGGEMLLVADATQDVYGKSKSWTAESMTNCGFRGTWAKLKTSYRLPHGMIKHIQEFAQQNIKSTEIDPPVDAGKQRVLVSDSLDARWIQLSPTFSNIGNIAINEVRSMLARREKQEQLSVFDVTLLVQTKRTGIEITNVLSRTYRIPCITTYSDAVNERSKKMAFGLGDYSVRATTIHSYKGWESRAVILVIEYAKSERDMALIYAGLTRLKWHPYGSFITVICADSRLTQYGKSWKNFREITL